MCIVCDAREMNRAAAEGNLAILESLMAVSVAMFKTLEAAKAALPEPATDDAKALAQRIADVLHKADTVMSGKNLGGDEATGAASVDALRAALEAQFPGAKVVIGTPDEISAVIEKETSGKKPN